MMANFPKELSVVDRLIVGVTTYGGAIVLIWVLFPVLFGFLAPLDVLPLPRPLNNLRLGSILSGFILCASVTAIPGMYKKRCDMLRRDRKLFVCRD